MGAQAPFIMGKDIVVSLRTVRIKDWYVKASVLDDQIFLVLFNIKTLTVYSEMFYNEVLAHSFIERVLSDDQNN